MGIRISQNLLGNFVRGEDNEIFIGYGKRRSLRIKRRS